MVLSKWLQESSYNLIDVPLYIYKKDNNGKQKSLSMQ